MPSRRPRLYCSVPGQGDHRPNSDVDLLVVVNDTSELSDRRVKNIADGAAWSKLSELPGKFGYDVIGITREQFGYCRRARNHIAAQALRDGVIMNYDEFDDLCDEDFNDDYPSGWPDITTAYHQRAAAAGQPESQYRHRKR